MTTLVTISVMLSGMAASLIIGYCAGVLSVTSALKTGRLISTEALKAAIKEDYYSKVKARQDEASPTVQ